MILVNPDIPTEGVLHTQPDTECYINTRFLGKGILYVSESRVMWKSSTTEEGLSLDYPHIAVHAVCNDASQFTQKHLYLMVDIDLCPEDNADEDSDEEEDQKSTSVRMMPQDPESLQAIYDAVSQGQLSNPPPDLSDCEEEDEDEGNYDLDGPLPRVRYENGDQFENVMENGFGEPVNGYVAPNDDEEQPEDMEQ